jgi:hypothetical protein
MFKLSNNDGSIISTCEKLTNNCPECGNTLYLKSITNSNNIEYVNYFCETGKHSGYTTKHYWEKGVLQKSENMDMEECYHYSQKLINDIQDKINNIKLNSYMTDYQKELIKNTETILKELYKQFEF